MMLLGAGVMVGVASVTAVLALSRSVIDTFAATLVHGAGAAQLQVSNGTAGLDRDLVDVIARLPGVAATGATVEHHVVLPAANRRITIFGAELSVIDETARLDRCTDPDPGTDGFRDRAGPSLSRGTGRRR